MIFRGGIWESRRWLDEIRATKVKEGNKVENPQQNNLDELLREKTIYFLSIYELLATLTTLVW